MLSGNTIEQVITDCNEFINTDKLDSVEVAYNVWLSFDLANKRVILTHWIWLDHIAQVRDKQFIYTAKQEPDRIANLDKLPIKVGDKFRVTSANGDIYEFTKMVDRGYSGDYIGTKIAEAKPITGLGNLDYTTYPKQE